MPFTNFLSPCVIVNVQNDSSPIIIETGIVTTKLYEDDGINIVMPMLAHNIITHNGTTG